MRRKKAAVDLPELWVALFPCGSWRVARTEKGAVESAVTIAGLCCSKGHTDFELRRFVHVQTQPSQSSPKTTPVLRLVKP